MDDVTDDPGDDREMESAPPPPKPSMGRRAGARVLDAIIVVGVSIAIGLPFTEEVEVDGETQLRLPVGIIVAGFLLALIYEVGCVAWRGQTPGKITLGLRVVDVHTGEKPTWGQAFRRWALPGILSYAFAAQLGLIISAVIYATGFFDPEGRNWPDKIARTRVVDVNRS
ncbi:MAG: RDD family protein [Actinomycetota bacterium]